MKRWLVLLLSFLLLTTGCAYAAINEQEESYLLYFREAELRGAAGGDALRAVPLRLNERPDSPEALAEELLQQLLADPKDEHLRRIAPEGTTLRSVELRNGRAVVDLSRAYASLSGVGLTLADYAIALTLSQIPEISSVQINVLGQKLAYREQQVFRAEDVLLSSQEDVVDTVSVQLYFLDAKGNLTAEQRELDLFEGDTQISAVVRALEAGPESRELRPLFPEGFRVKTLRLEEDTCYVNLSSAQLTLLPEDEYRSTVLEGLSRSLCSLKQVEQVEFLVNGEYAVDPVEVQLEK